VILTVELAIAVPVIERPPEPEALMLSGKQGPLAVI
jgi:hypothetical protein